MGAVIADTEVRHVPGQGLSPNILDGVLVVVGLLALLRGWRQGALVALLSLGGLVLGLLAGAWVAPRVAAWFLDEPGAGTALLSLGLLLVAILVGQGIGLRLGLALRRGVVRIGAGPVDRVLGLGVGLAGTALVVWLLAGVLAQGPIPAVARQVQGSEIVGALDRSLPPRPAVVGEVAAYLDRQGFPAVFAGLGGGISAPPVAPTADAAVAAAARAGQPSTVRVRGLGCGTAIGFGSGFVTAPGVVVTNAHVVAGFDRLTVEDTTGRYTAEPVLVDPALDVAVLRAPELGAPPLAWSEAGVGRGDEGATLGFPGGSTDLVVEPATVRTRIDAVGRDVDGGASVRREVLVLAAAVERGDSGGPFVTADGRVGGVVFAGAPDGSPTGYALTVEQVRPVVADAVLRDTPVDTGACRF
ncbi:MarP family serine protease [Actinomycetospora straminea]|uniref:MarP family serine protease n=1 Tax=Actinomycetospora straminea TaxID=663607 RepID=A0ABP9E8K1_9PSEU